MFKNRKGESKGNTVLIIAAVIIALYLFVPSFKTTISDLFGGSSPTPAPTTGITDSSTCPSSGITSLTLNVQDALATTATAITSDYYVFNGMKLITNGNTGSDGSIAIDVNCGKDFKIVVINETTGSGNGAYGKIVDYQARIASDSLNVQLYPIGGAVISMIENPNQPRGTAGVTNNVTLNAGGTHSFVIDFAANGTAKAYQNPIILCQVNISSIDYAALTISSFSDQTPIKEVTVPARISANAGYKYKAWEYGKMLETRSGTIYATGTIAALGSVTPAIGDSMQCKIVDQQYWKKANYQAATSPEQAFLFGAENTETTSDVGGTDSSVAYLYFTAGLP